MTHSRPTSARQINRKASDRTVALRKSSDYIYCTVNVDPFFPASSDGIHTTSAAVLYRQKLALTKQKTYTLTCSRFNFTFFKIFSYRLCKRCQNILKIYYFRCCYILLILPTFLNAFTYYIIIILYELKLVVSFQSTKN